MGRLGIGAIGYLDGRDPNAQSPLTIGELNLWDSPARKRVVGKLHHGAKVRIQRKEWHEKEGRWYYHVRHSPLKRGWIPDVFVSSERQEPVGEII